MICPVSSMKNGQWGELIEINGGEELIDKLASLGIHPGVRIEKKYGLYGRGPVVLTVGTGEVAVGYSMAARMMVQVEGTESPQEASPQKRRRRLFMQHRGRGKRL